LTTLCNQNTLHEDFVFNADAVMAILFEHTLSLVPHEPSCVELASGGELSGRVPTKRIVGVSVLRAGLTMEAALGRCVQAVALGRLLIQTNADTGEPELHHASLPDLKDCIVVLMDPLIASGAAAMMAVRVLLDHGMAQEDIFLTTIFSTDRGLHAVAYAFPRVNIVTASLDHKLDDKGRIEPSLGNFGDRYYGTEQAYYEEAVTP
jgi:uridine kinase